MKKIIPILLVVLLFAFTSHAASMFVPNIFDIDSRIPVQSEIDPWVVMEDWLFLSTFNCPEGDPMDFHIVLVNPDPNGKIRAVELVIGKGGIIGYGALCSYSYIDGKKWRVFVYDVSKRKYFEYHYSDPDEVHGGTHFNKGKPQKPMGGN